MNVAPSLIRVSATAVLAVGIVGAILWWYVSQRMSPQGVAVAHAGTYADYDDVSCVPEAIVSKTNENLQLFVNCAGFLD